MRKRIGALVAVIAVVAGLGFSWTLCRKTKVLRLPGVVEIQEVRLGPRIAGRVGEVFVSEGDLVQGGQPLVRLDVPELDAQREVALAKVRESEATLEKARNGPRVEEKDSAKAALEAAQARLKRLKAGNRVEEIRQAKSELESNEADLRLAREDYDRSERIFRQSAGTRAELDLNRAAVSRFTGRVAAARARLDLLLAGSRIEDIEEAAAEVKRLDANYHLLRAGTRAEEIAEIEARLAESRGKLREIDVNLKEAIILAPEPAVIEVLAVRKGDLVQANQPVLRVLRAADLWVKTYVPETDLGKVKLNADVEVRIDSHGNRRFAGKILQISSESEFTPRNVQSIDERRHQVFGIRVRVADPQGVFKSGMFAEVLVPLVE